MVSLSLLAPSKVASALVLVLGLADICNAAAKYHMGHKLPTNVGGTYYVDGFHGGVMNAKFQSMTNSVPGNSQYVDLTYNFNLGNFDQAYWILLPTSFGGANECFAVYKNCDVTIRFWDKKDPLPNWYTLA
ncbi:hypothetical protein BDP81DRAFT_404379 [Colletotrichum phormii]|uniref:Uncharacterized protein n=1 Tax=Colletotrichum phormii TaxID=359342 RepID=A0AAJ0EGT5_9PEZI|nr:uncharacterized protein BDP81DRAFT_404379 [Colletotrichum phormii]KAK1639682.1 hypothetical protein BDP81DRAFT_404379 [Colletotrichum phormii]